MTDEKESTGFRVVDKRRFNDDPDRVPESDFQVREEAPLEATATQGPQDGSGGMQPGGGQGGGPLDFSSFVIGLYTQGLMLLGEIPNPETGTRVEHIEGARQSIDILGVLEDKTKGNLSPDEEKLLQEVVSTLRLAYVNKVR